MASERTLAIVKPDAVARGLTGTLLARIESEGLRIVALRMVRLSPREVEGFYAVHRDKPFFSPLVAFMTSGPSVLAVLEGEDAIRRWRACMGATDPMEADEGTIRRTYAESKQRNAVHGSDGPSSAAFEIGWFFRGLDLA
ncbi:MAG: nucleoside-diphosphate kinase [Deltaproteobacteria bacterium]|nr:nucleoside-diphosphate kinase [Deltaproteobacteria bacterium]